MTAYEPTICLQLRRGHKRLYVILAADGVVLDAQEYPDGIVPRWVTELAQIPVVDVTAGTYQNWRAFGAVRVTAEAWREAGE